MKKVISILLAILCLYYTNPILGTVYNVPGDSATIQGGINLASYGDTVQVAAGTYVENITLKNGVALIGEVISNDPNNTIIDGNNAGSVVYSSNCDPNTVLDGFTITNGNGGYGGGMYNSGSSLIINNCTITGNSAAHGGGMNNLTSNPIISNCTFSNNSAGNSSAAMLNTTSSPTITNCTFIQNSAVGGCGGIFNYSGSSPVITNCIFTQNSAANGGAMVNYSYCYPKITYCAFNGNSVSNGSAGWGGGIYNYNYSDPNITNCIFSGNSASGFGGAIYDHTSCNPILENCILWGNSAPDGPQIYNNNNSTPTLTYCDIEGCGESGAGWDSSLGTDSGGNIDIDPNFVNPIPANGDYHLKSQAGHWDETTETWITDNYTSPCIDAGNPLTPIGWEPYPNGGIINMGAYGGTTEASKSYFGTSPCETPIAGDINGDCRVDLIDFSLMAFHWLEGTQ